MACCGWPTAAVPMENPYCSCTLTRIVCLCSAAVIPNLDVKLHRCHYQVGHGLQLQSPCRTLLLQL